MILSVIDYLTKWVELKALPSGKAEGVAKFLWNRIFLRHGAPKYIISDRGKCFLAELSQHLMKRMGITHRTTSSYHAQCNGLTERLNHTIAMIISMTVEPTKNKNWDQNLKETNMAINTSKQESTQTSPFKNIYGREPSFPIDIFMNTDPNPHLHAELADLSYADRVMEEFKIIRQRVKENTEIVQRKQKLRYDKKHRPQDFKAGDLVLIYRPFRKVGCSEKLLHRWLGPRKVIRQTTPVNYEVQSISGRGKTDIVHVVSMKPFHELVDQSGSDWLGEGDTQPQETEPLNNDSSQESGNNPRK